MSSSCKTEFVLHVDVVWLVPFTVSQNAIFQPHCDKKNSYQMLVAKSNHQQRCINNSCFSTLFYFFIYLFSKSCLFVAQKTVYFMKLVTVCVMQKKVIILLLHFHVSLLYLHTQVFFLLKYDQFWRYIQMGMKHTLELHFV